MSEQTVYVVIIGRGDRTSFALVAYRDEADAHKRADDERTMGADDAWTEAVTLL